MQTRLRVPTSVWIALTIALITWMAVGAIGQFQPGYKAPRLIGTQHPDLNGIWQALNSANYDIEPHVARPSPLPGLLGAIGAEPAGQGIVAGGTIPYQAWAVAKKKENFEKRFTRPTTHDLNETTGDPEAKCYLPGVPRATYLGLPFQITETANHILMTYEFANATRMVYLDRKPDPPANSWMGLSIGSWD